MKKTVILALVVLLALPALAAAQERDTATVDTKDSIKPANKIFIQTQFFISVFSDDLDRAILANTGGYGFTGGYKFPLFGVFLHIEQNFWATVEYNREIKPGALNVALGIEKRYFQGRARSSLSFGTSTLLFDTAFDKKGHTGIFLEVVPLGLMFGILDWLSIGLNPISFALVAPVLGTPSILMHEYRTRLFAEVSF
ncbi:MAG: hypothetical protein GY754_19040 [bacterium]|nr:hypothetical protein [bacterium]